MALTDENVGGGIPATMLVGPTGYSAYGGGQGGFGNSFGGDGWWIILLFILLGGWGNGWGNGWGGNGFGGNNGNDLYPWMNQSNQINNGFRDQMLNTSIGNIQTGIQNLSTQLCNCCGDMQMAMANGFAGVEQSANARQMADMNQNFAMQTAMMQGFNGVQAGQADLRYTVATENCADRTAALQNTRDIIDAQTRGTQAILDKLCALELDGVKGQLAQAQRENVGLQNQLNMASFRESQIAQNAFIQQGFANEVDQLYNRLSNCPVPSTPVYGRTPIFTCNNNGCGCNS